MPGPKLPQSLLRQVQGQESHKQKRTAKYRNEFQTRKERRKDERTQKKTYRVSQRQKSDPESSFKEGKEPISGDTTSRRLTSKRKRPSIDIPLTSEPPPYRREKLVSTSEPPTKVRKVTKEDTEIASLERKLGIRKKTPNLDDEGLEAIFGDLGGGEGSEEDDHQTGGNDEYEKWLKSKRNRQPIVEVQNKEATYEPEDSNNGNSSHSLSLDSEDSEDREDDDDSESDFEDFESEDVEKYYPISTATTRKENPYLPGGGLATSADTKYVPPSLRYADTSADEASLRLRRQAQGLLNKLSEANLLSIVGDVTKLYQSNARQHVTSTLIDLLLVLLSDKTALSDTFLILHASFISAIHKTVGLDFSAQAVEKIVNCFDGSYSKIIKNEESDKQCNNLISLLTQLYNFQVISSTLVFDLIRELLQSLSELHAELLLRVVKSAGANLRKDDPTALKDVVSVLKARVADIGGENNLSVRTKFMIETIGDLKDNRLKTGRGLSAVNAEHLIRLKKVVGSLNARELQASEPLSVGLSDIRSVRKRGKWWLVGASWKGPSSEHQQDANVAKSRDNSHRSSENNESASDDDDASTDLLRLAQNQRMNTSIRRGIFLTMMSASDFVDTHHRLLKLNLTKTQELEIPRVLLHCAGAEGRYNPYYTLIAKKLCKDRKLKMAFQFGAWDLFRKMGEEAAGAADEDDGVNDDSGKLGIAQVATYSRLYGTLVVGGSLSIVFLKALDLTRLKAQTSMFVEGLLVTIFTVKQKSTGTDELSISNLTLEDIFEPVKDLPELSTGLRWFLKTVMGESSIPEGARDQQKVAESCKRVRRYLVHQ